MFLNGPPVITQKRIHEGDARAHTTERFAVKGQLERRPCREGQLFRQPKEAAEEWAKGPMVSTAA